ncbi:hypothetical protein GH742_02835 [Legionella sp. MW5194]|uniref:ABC-type transport auxiliary lipoprotein family protein n=1 Tax=Legionella sp. MW5194 TaxID=2662448 RepID=UPI00193CA0D6|nr:ABC-type transport auxiliary lipoprotein family protein [Legionella sp. MW5194]QRN02890.1 hypothetical protein GH742_02835 [Legionella sp. MW5194]
MKKVLIASLILTLLGGCSVKQSVTNQYKLDAYSQKQYGRPAGRVSILVTAPEAVSGYDTSQMVYVKKPFEVLPFVHNAWIEPPADMLFPLISQSLQRSGYFYAVATSPISDKTDYRLDTQLIELEQNFLTCPSTMAFVAKAVLTRINDNQVLASRDFRFKIPCPADTPYGGVMAANQITVQFTAELTEFIVSHIRHDRHK